MNNRDWIIRLGWLSLAIASAMCWFDIEYKRLDMEIFDWVQYYPPIEEDIQT